MLALPGNAEHLLHVGEREQAVERGDAFDGAGVEATVERLLGSVGETPLGVALPVGLQQGLMGLGSIALDREQVVGAVGPHDGIGSVAGRVQRIHGDHGAAEVDVFQHREHRRVLPARFVADPAGHRHGLRMGDQRHGFVMHVPVAVHAVDPLAVRRQRRGVRERMGLHPAVGCGLHPVAVRQRDHPMDRRSRRRNEAPAEALPPCTRRRKVLLRHALRVARGRVATDLARQPRQHPNGQHRRQLVPPPQGLAEVRHPLQLLQKRRQRILRRIHRLARNCPVRMRLRRAQPGHRRAAQRVDVHLPGLAVGIRIPPRPRE